MLEKFVDDRRLITPLERKGVLLGPVTATLDLHLVDLRAPAVTGLFRGSPKLDGRLGGGGDYDKSQAWGARIHDCAPDAHGLLYHARKAGEDCVALYGDRVGRLLVPSDDPVDIDDPGWAIDRDAFTTITGVIWGH